MKDEAGQKAHIQDKAWRRIMETMCWKEIML